MHLYILFSNSCVGMLLSAYILALPASSNFPSAELQQEYQAVV